LLSVRSCTQPEQVVSIACQINRSVLRERRRTNE
jgi:hypothetical protein